MKKDIKQFLLQKEFDHWLEENLKENKDMMEDYKKLCGDLLLFRFKWGVEIGFIFKNHEENKGRGLGVGVVDKLFETQNVVNKKSKK